MSSLEIKKCEERIAALRKEYDKMRHCTTTGGNMLRHAMKIIDTQGNIMDLQDELIEMLKIESSDTEEAPINWNGWFSEDGN